MPLILPSNSISDLGFSVANSLRFNRDNVDKLTRTFSSGNRRTYTISSWIKRGRLGIDYQAINVASGGDEGIFFDSSDRINLFFAGGGANITNAVYRDVSAWYHIVVAIDTTQATSSDRIKLYVNGVQETSWSATGTPVQNYDTLFNNSGGTNVIGSHSVTTAYSFDGYLAETVLIDGTALDPTSFGEFDEDTGIWKPIDVSGLTFGTNGFYLPFENSGALGQDDSGNGNNFTVNNLTSIDQTTDTPTNNYATWNPLDNYYCAGTLSDGNLTVVTGASQFAPITGTIGVSTGKWYWEVIPTATSFSVDFMIGVKSAQTTSSSQELGRLATDYGYYISGTVRNNAGYISPYGNSYGVNDIIGIALDLDNNKLYFSKNGVWQNSGDPTSGATGTGAISITAPSSTGLGNYFPAVSDYYSGTTTFKANFGNPTFTISSGNSDGNGYGNFEYAVPSGYYALNTKNLAEYG